MTGLSCASHPLTRLPTLPSNCHMAPVDVPTNIQVSFNAAHRREGGSPLPSLPPSFPPSLPPSLPSLPPATKEEDEDEDDDADDDEEEADDDESEDATAA